MTHTTPKTRHVVGTMTGTSIDGVDIAYLELIGSGLEMKPRFIRLLSYPLDDIADCLRKVTRLTKFAANDFAKLALDLGDLHVEAIKELLDEGEHIDLIALSGQTIYHNPPVSWQIINPNPVARAFGCPVVFDLRQADLAAGGEGAPITPLSDWILFRHPERERAIVNLGGFCNITVLPQADSPHPLNKIEGFDLCPCNHLLDTVSRAVLNKHFDDRGQSAGDGEVHKKLADDLTDLLRSLFVARRSMGSTDDVRRWVLTNQTVVPPGDLAATAVRALATTISNRLNATGVDEVILAGGGAMNDTLVNGIKEACTADVMLSDDVDMPIQAREAAGLAILGALSADGVPITLPQVTACHAPPPVSGSWCFPTGM